MFERPHIAASGARELMQLVQESQRARLALAANFESRFEDLVTEGAASGYPALVEQFRPLFAACDATLEALATALAGREGGAAASRLVTSLVREERMRHDAHLKVCGDARGPFETFCRGSFERHKHADAALDLP